MAYREQGYLAFVDGEHVALSHCAMKCLGSCSFNTGVFQVNPTEYEFQGLDCTVPELCAIAVRLGWMRPASLEETARRFVRVADLRAALSAARVKPKGLKADLLRQVTEHCPEWLDEFARKRPSFVMLDKGVIELQAHRERVGPPSLDHTKEGHRKLVRGYLATAVAAAQEPESQVLGFKVTVRRDWKYCPLSSRFSGLFMADELPHLYPADCPDESACACVSYNAVLCGDGSNDAHVLEQRHLERFGESPCPRHWTENYAPDMAAPEPMADSGPEQWNVEPQTIAAPATVRHDSMLRRLWRFILGRA